MPNNVYQKLSMTGGNLDELKEIFKDGDILNKITPCPEELLKVEEDKYVRKLSIGTPFVQIYQTIMAEEHEPNNRKEAIANLQLANSCKKNYGYVSWHDWRLDNWGTKWDVYNYDVEFEDDAIYATFDTAWSNCATAIETLSKKFPNTYFELQYADEDMGSNCGELAWENGELVSEYIPDRYSDEAYQFAIEVKQENDEWYYDEIKDKWLYIFFTEDDIVDDKDAELYKDYYYGSTKEEVVSNANDFDLSGFGALIKIDNKKGFLLETEDGAVWAKYLIEKVN